MKSSHRPSVTFIREAGPDQKIFRAKWVCLDPDRIMENGCVQVENGKITDIFKAGQTTRGARDMGPGVLMPFLVNGHVHLELSALKNKLPLGQGFGPWVKALVEKRQELGPAGLAPRALDEAKNLVHKGMGMVGEISTLGLTMEMIGLSGLGGVWFQEWLGNTPGDSLLEKGGRLFYSGAGHAPHTTDPGLLKKVKKATGNRGLPFSIHVAETRDERDFLQGRKGEWNRFLKNRGIETRHWPLGSKTPVRYLDHLGLLDPLTLCVHLIHADKKDMDILGQSGARVCICPRSNHNLHGRLPDVEAMLDKDLTIALGTDSLASCSSLSIFDEMAYIKKSFQRVDPKRILTMATLNGARALGLDHVAGTLDRGKESAFIYLNLEAGNESRLIEKVTSNEF